MSDEDRGRTAVAQPEVGTAWVYDPTADAETAQGTLAARPSTLDGKAIGLLNNSKDQVDVFLAQVESLIHEGFPSARTVNFRKRSTSHPAPFLAEVAEQCDVVINGVGD